MKVKNILIIVIIIILVLAVAGIGIGYIYLKTDTFKSDKELFFKYINQNIETVKEIAESSIYKNIKEMKNEDIYESETEIKLKYAEGGEVSNKINDISFKFSTQKDNEYVHKDMQLLYQNQEFIQIEGIKNEDIYGIRFSDILRQFLSIRNDGNLTEEAQKIGIDEKILETLISLIDSDKTLLDTLFTKEELQALKDKYAKILINNLNTASFAHAKNSIITYKNVSTKVNAYSVTLNEQQIKQLIEQILTELKNDEILLNKIGQNNEEQYINMIDSLLEEINKAQIPIIGVIVYEQKGRLLRTIIDIKEQENIIIETENENNNTLVTIERKELNNQEEKTQKTEIQKTNLENEENYALKTDIIDGEEQYSIKLDLQTKNTNSSITSNLNITAITGITEVGFSAESVITTMANNNKIELNTENNVILTDLDDEVRERVLNTVKTGVPDRLLKRVQVLLNEIGLNIFGIESQDLEEEQKRLKQIEINTFNSRFEFYTGNTVSGTNVKALLDVVKLNFNSVEYLTIENDNQNQSFTAENTNAETTEIIKLNIEKDRQSIEEVKEVASKIGNQKTYKVSITYKESNGLIDYITITEAK